MEKNELIRRFAFDDEDKILAARILDKLEGCERKCVPTYTRFLTDRQRVMAQGLIAACGSPSHAFLGGCEAAERTVLIFLPDWMEQPPTGGDSPIACIRAEFNKENPPGHRDILGALMGCGLMRDTVGDIFISPQSADVVLLREMLPYVTQNLESAGRARLSVKEIHENSLIVPAQSFELKKDTMSSLRLDSLVSSGFNMSREKAAELIRSGRVSLDHADCLKPDKAVTQGARVSARGLGKIELFEVGGLTKKGRTAVTIKKYV